jgi:adenylate kinase family enzyme
MKRVLILGRGASGKSTLARTLGELTGLPVIELDKVFWNPSLEPLSAVEWADAQRRLVQNPEWIMDGDLGPYDVVDIRIREADTIVLLDYPLALCAWRALRRSRERADFWRWLLAYRRKFRPALVKALASNAPAADVRVLRNPAAVRQFVEEIARKLGSGGSGSPGG